MADLRLRQLERLAATGEQDAVDAYVRELERAGTVFPALPGLWFNETPEKGLFLVEHENGELRLLDDVTHAIFGVWDGEKVVREGRCDVLWPSSLSSKSRQLGSPRFHSHNLVAAIWSS